MMQDQRTFRLFVSSTFSDFQTERELLQFKVFPEVEQYCAEQGFQFLPIDLRWGVTEEAQLDQKTMQICLEEVKACKSYPHPNFLMMLGNRYGWVPLPYMIVQTEFEMILEHSSDESKEQLFQWYRLDQNQIPASYFLAPREGEFVDPNIWEGVESELRSILQTAAVKANVDNQEKYFVSATEQEAIYGICGYHPDILNVCEEKVEDDQDNILVYLKGDKLDDDYRLTEFKNEIVRLLPNEKVLSSLEDESFVKNMIDHLKEMIDQQASSFEEMDDLKKERYAHENFKNEKTALYVGLQEALQRVQNYMDSNSTQPLVIYGKSGIGKTAFMAKAIEQTNKTKVIYRFVGVSDKSTQLRSLLISICTDILGEEREYDLNEQKFFKQVHDVLNAIQQETVIFIDALDQLNKQTELSWIPKVLPNSLKLVVSVLKDGGYEEDSNYYEQFHQKIDSSNLMELRTPTIEDARLIIRKLLLKENRTLNLEQEKLVLKKYEDVKIPLYLVVAIQTVKNWCSYDEVNASSLGSSTQGQIQIFFDDLTRLYHHPKILVERILAYIQASKNGLSEKDILEILGLDEDIMKVGKNNYHINKATKIPLSIWLRLKEHIRPFLLERIFYGKKLISFYHRQFATVVQDFLPVETCVYQDLANYFFRIQNEQKTWNHRYYDTHMLDEVPYLLLNAKDFEKLKSLITDLEFTGSIFDNRLEFDFLEIIRLFLNLEKLEDSDLHLWESFYIENAHLIKKMNLPSWRAHQSLFQLGYEDGYESPVRKQAEDLLKKNKVDFRWLKNTARPAHISRKGIKKVLDRHTAPVMSAIELNDSRILSGSANEAIFWSNQGEILSILNYSSEKVIHISDNKVVLVSQYKNALIIDYEAKVLGEIRVTPEDNQSIRGVIDIGNHKILTYSDDKKIKIYNILGELLVERVVHNETVNGVIQLKTGELVSFSNDKTLKIWDSTMNGYILLEGHTDSVVGAVELKDGRVLSYSNDTILRLWNRDGTLSKVFSGHSDSIRNVIELSTGNILSSGDDDRLILWDTNGNQLRVMEGHTEFISGMFELSTGDILSYSGDKTLVVWNKDGEKKHILKGHKDFVIGALELSNGYILSRSADETMMIWNKNGERISVLQSHGSEIWGMMELKSKVILSYSQDNTLRLWEDDLKTLKEVNHSFKVISNFFVASHGTFIVDYKDYETSVFDKDGYIIHTFTNTLTRNVFTIELSDGLFISSTIENYLIKWDKSGTIHSTFQGHQSQIVTIFQLQNGNIFSSSDDGVSIIWDTLGDVITTFRNDLCQGCHVLELKNGNILLHPLAYHKSPFIGLWKYNKDVTILESHVAPICGVLALKNGNFISHSSDGNMKLWDGNGVLLRDITIHKSLITLLVELSNGTIVSHSSHQWMRMWNEYGDEIGSFGTYVYKLFELNNGNLLVSSSADRLYLLPKSNDYVCLDGLVSAPKEIIELKNDNFLTYSNAYGSEKNSICIWNQNGEVLSTFEDYKERIEKVVKLKNQNFVTWAHDNTIRLWNKKGKMLSTFYLPCDNVNEVFFDKFSKIVISNGKQLFWYEICLNK